MSTWRKILRGAAWSAAGVAIAAAALLTWLRVESSRPLDDWHRQRHGDVVETGIEPRMLDDGQLSEFVTVRSDSGLEANFRVLRDPAPASALPVLIVLGGHETGSRAVELFGRVGGKAVVAMDYPYAGESKIRGLRAFIENLPAMRRAMRDTPVAVLLAVDWLLTREWADADRIVLAGVSLGVPFAAAAAAADERIASLVLVHGAADNQAWFETNVARRLSSESLVRPVATLLNWLAYGPAYDTAGYVARTAPRPVLIIGARNDERTPAGQSERLFEAARGPRVLRWTEGRHVQPGRPEVVAELLAITDAELPFLTGRPE